MFNEMLVKQIY